MKNWIPRGLLIVPMLSLSVFLAQCCKKVTNGDCTRDEDLIVKLEPVEGTAKDIILTVFDTDWQGTIIDSVELATEGSVVIALEQGPGDTIVPAYNVYARADGYYTELYKCWDGDTINVDLDSIPEYPNAFAGTIFGHWEFFGVSLHAMNISLTQMNGVSVTTTTDGQGRWGLGNLPTGVYTLIGDCISLSHCEFTNTEATDYDDFHFYFPGYIVEAPNLYLYPENETDITVNLGFPAGGEVIESEPSYGDGWRVHVEPNGLINEEYGYLFYEAHLPGPLNSTTGWLLKGNDLEGEFRRLLEQHGFVGREVDDFVDYWVPILAGSPWYAVYQQEAGSMVTLDISPTPHNVLRTWLLIEPVNQPLDIPAPPDPGPFVRDGFTVVEWGVFRLSRH